MAVRGRSGAEKIQIDMPRAGAARRGRCIFSENTARTSSRHRRPREEWKNNILPFRPEFSALAPLLPFFLLLRSLT